MAQLPLATQPLSGPAVAPVETVTLPPVSAEAPAAASDTASASACVMTPALAPEEPTSSATDNVCVTLPVPLTPSTPRVRMRQHCYNTISAVSDRFVAS